MTLILDGVVQKQTKNVYKNVQRDCLSIQSPSAEKNHTERPDGKPGV